MKKTAFATIYALLFAGILCISADPVMAKDKKVLLKVPVAFGTPFCRLVVMEILYIV
jgi:hypothetical protein